MTTHYMTYISNNDNGILLISQVNFFIDIVEVNL